MIKYVPQMTSVVMEEIPDKVTLAVDISRCQGTCEGCHSPFLRQDIGEELTPAVIDTLLGRNFGVDCFLFLGEGDDPARLLELAAYVRKRHAVSVALYSGRPAVEDSFFQVFDYVKVGPYIPAFGPLNVPTTNQRLYKVVRHGGESVELEDITSRMQHRGTDSSR